jgi:hypothetical protein
LTNFPKDDELSFILIEISIFLKEFSQFEGKSVPMFRHPKIRGKEDLE